MQLQLLWTCIFTSYTRPPLSLFPILTVSQYALPFSKRYPLMALVVLKSEEITLIGLEEWDFHLTSKLVKIVAWGATETHVLEILGILMFVCMQILRLGPFAILLFFLIVVSVIMNLNKVILCPCMSQTYGYTWHIPTF